MASAGTRASALLFSFSAFVLFFLLQAPPPAAQGLADLVVSALDRFLDGRCLLELATRRNMILLCHAILLVILRDAGVLGMATGRRSRSPEGGVVAQTAAVPVPARPHATRSTVVWRRRPRNRATAAPMHDAAAAAAARRLVECQPAAKDAATSTWAAPLLKTGPPAQAETEEAAAVATGQIVLAESPRNGDDDDDNLLDQYHGRDAVAETAEHPTAIAVDGKRDCDDDRRIIAVAADDDGDARTREQQTAGSEMELADDRTFEEFIENQRRKMRQESMQLVSSRYHYQEIAT